MLSDMNIAVILPAAGQGRRFGKSGTPKLEMDLGGRIVLVRAIELFSGRPQVKQILVAVDPDQIDTFRFKWGDQLGFLGAKIVAGGRKERWETVANAMKELDPAVTHVAVHDAARPVTDAAMIDRVLTAATTYPAVIPGVPCHATIKRVEDKSLPDPAGEDPLDAILGSAGKDTIEAYRVMETVPRNGLWLVQTPQVFERSLLERAYAPIGTGKVGTDAVTDDAALVEALGEPVVVVAGDPMNVKITVPQDVKFAEAVMLMRSGKIESDRIGAKRKHPTWAESSED